MIAEIIPLIFLKEDKLVFRRKLGALTADLDAPAKGTRPKRQDFHKCNDSKVLPKRCAGELGLRILFNLGDFYGGLIFRCRKSRR